MVKWQDPRGITNNEIIVTKLCNKSFKRQNKYLQNNRKKIYNNPEWVKHDLKIINKTNENWTLILKATEDEVFGGLRNEMWIYSLIESLNPQISKVAVIWYLTSYKRNTDWLQALDIEKDLDLPKHYTELYADLQLSNYKGSITRTTKETILSMVDSWIENNLTINELATQISWLETTLFPQSRAEMIAQTELAKAYEYWNYLPMKQAQNQGADVQKLRSTVNDARVRPSHMDAQAEWRVPFDYIYWNWNSFPPEWVRCRCTIKYKIK